MDLTSPEHFYSGPYGIKTNDTPGFVHRGSFLLTLREIVLPLKAPRGGTEYRWHFAAGPNHAHGTYGHYEIMQSGFYGKFRFQWSTRGKTKNLVKYSYYGHRSLLL